MTRSPVARLAIEVALTMVLVGCGGSTSSSSPAPLGSGPMPSVVTSTASPGAAGPTVTSPRMVDDEADHVVLMFGVGSGGASATWTWDGRSWTERHPSVSPPAVAGASLAYDAARQAVVLFGGSVSGAPSAETWIWKAGAWSQQHPATSPPARAEASAAFDPVVQVVLLFGGCCSGEQYAPTLLNDTWAWNGQTWTARTPSTAPGARQGASLVEDPGRQRLLLYGGSEQGKSGQNGDTWIWDGHDWSAARPARAPAADAVGAAAAPHRASGRVVLFAGYAIGAQTWTWDGSTWTLLPIDFGPPARTRWIAAEDATRGQVVLFDIVDAAASGQTWTWDGRAWSRSA